MRRREMAQGDGHSRRVVRFRLDASGGARPAGQAECRICHGPRTCIWKARTSIAAGSTARLLIGVGVRGRAPYRQVLTHGWTLDEQGRPMSKSLGNVILPTEICEKWGADLLRLWVASQDYTATCACLRT